MPAERPSPKPAGSTEPAGRTGSVGSVESVAAGRLTVVERLCALPFPAEVGRYWAPEGWGGPGFHLLVLQETRDFWDGRGPEVTGPAEQEVEDAEQALAALLTARWGPPESVGLRKYADTTDPDPLPEPLDFLGMLSGGVRLWRLPGTVRWVGLSIGQGDPELPIQLLLAVGEVSALPRNCGEGPAPA
ncbi:hypothetical protein ACFY00_29435 [Kitasatospora sp. NPDC001540]|uniref:hypothetical protein n=1 Tax=Kitasatospora sp. NPDC001540 TaxID=3364014 RepID=UPI0036B1B370